MNDKKVVDVFVPVSVYILAGPGEPPAEIGRAIAKANMVDWAGSQVSVAPLQPWAGHVDESYPRKLFRRIQKKFPALAARLEVIEVLVKLTGPKREWGEKITVQAV